MMDLLPEKPRLIIDTEVVTQEEFNFISVLEKDIQQQPEIFLRALGSLTLRDENGKKILDDSWEHEHPKQTADAKVNSTEEVIRTYLDNNYGKAVELDEDGEDALAAQEIYPILITAIQTQKGIKAETAKSQLARLTLRVFAERIIEWKNASPTEIEPLPEAS